MPQLSLYLDSSTMDVLRAHAARDNTSLSKYVSNMIGEYAASGWPEGFWDLYGALQDETFAEPDELDYSQDAPRSSW